MDAPPRHPHPHPHPRFMNNNTISHPVGGMSEGYVGVGGRDARAEWGGGGETAGRREGEGERGSTVHHRADCSCYSS